MTVSIIIADDFPASRTGARAWLEKYPDFQIIGEARDGWECVRLAGRLQPNVLVSDVSMPGLDAFEVMRAVRETAPRTRAVVWSPRAEEEYLLAALREGALGFVLKTSPAEVLVKAVRSAAKEAYFLDPSFVGQPIEDYLRTVQEAPGDLLQCLTQREREVLQFVAEGSTSAETARRLHISPRTVEQHRARMMRKLHLRSQTDLVRFALRRGIIAWEG